MKALFEKGVEYYEENMALMVEIQVGSSLTPGTVTNSILLCRIEPPKVEPAETSEMFTICLETFLRRFTTTRRD